MGVQEKQQGCACKLVGFIKMKRIKIKETTKETRNYLAEQGELKWR